MTKVQILYEAPKYKHIERDRKYGGGFIGKVKDITGQKFGRLTAIELIGLKADASGNRRAFWLCKCDCGNYVEVCGVDLRSGHTKSCGCIHKEMLTKRNQEMSYRNIYDLSGEYGIGYDSKNSEFYFDLEDYNKIKDDYWMVGNNGYVVTSNNKKHMHRVIMGVDGDAWTDIQVDHIKTNQKNNNRKCNLRIATPSQNGMNKKLYSNNTSGCTGVYWNKSRSKWTSYISINKKFVCLGFYKNKEDAIKARKEAEEKYYGEFSYDNSQMI